MGSRPTGAYGAKQLEAGEAEPLCPVRRTARIALAERTQVVGAGHKPFLDRYLCRLMDVQVVQLADLVNKRTLKGAELPGISSRAHTSLTRLRSSSSTTIRISRFGGCRSSVVEQLAHML